MDRAVAIVNPKSAGGKSAQIWARVRSKLPPSVDVLMTSFPGHAMDLTRAALKDGAHTIIAVGGDGTVNEVVNGFFEDGSPIGDGVLGIIPQGTGSDMCRSLGLPLDAKEAAFIVQHAIPKGIDLMRVMYTGHDGSSKTRYAINVISFGMGGVVASRVSGWTRRFGAKVGYLITVGLTTLSYRGSVLKLTFDGDQQIDARVMNVAVGNGQFHGAAMHVCPNARLDDGLLDVTIIRHMSVIGLASNISMIYNGRILDHPKVQALRAKHVRAQTEDVVFLEIDGEPLGRLPAQIEVIPQAIRVLV